MSSPFVHARACRALATWVAYLVALLVALVPEGGVRVCFGAHHVDVAPAAGAGCHCHGHGPERAPEPATSPGSPCSDVRVELVPRATLAAGAVATRGARRGNAYAAPPSAAAAAVRGVHAGRDAAGAAPVRAPPTAAGFGSAGEHGSSTAWCACRAAVGSAGGACHEARGSLLSCDARSGPPAHWLRARLSVVLQV